MRNLTKKAVLGLVAVGLISTSLVGCGKKVTVESLFTDSKAAFSDSKSYDMTLGVNVDGSMSMSEESSMDLKLKLDLDMKAESDKGIYTRGAMNIGLFGMTQEQAVETYTSIDDNSVLNYSYSVDDDSWEVSKSDIDEELNNSLDKLVSINYSKIYESLTLSDETEDYNGTEAYHVSGDISGDILKDIIKEVAKAIDEDMDTSQIDSTDLTGLVVSSDFYFSKEDTRLLGVKIDLAKSDFSKVSSTGDTEASVNFNELNIVFTINGVNNYTYEVPSDVVNSAKESEKSLSDSIIQ